MAKPKATNSSPFTPVGDPELKKYPRSPRLLVNVTAEQIEKSIKADSSHCMIAEAIKTAYPAAKSWLVDLQIIRFSDPKRGLCYVYLTPRLAQQSLIDFDQSARPAPFRFNLAGAHVIPMGLPSGTAKKRTPGRKPVAHRKASRKVLVTRTPGRRTTGRRRAPVLEPFGGKAAPVGNFAKARTFGLRLLGRRSAEQLAQWRYVEKAAAEAKS
jgi:hypothetical protein